MKLRVFNYSTSEKVKEWEAHTDYIRTVEVHPTLPYVLSSSDDMSVKLWDWEKGFQNTQEVRVWRGRGEGGGEEVEERKTTKQTRTRGVERRDYEGVITARSSFK